MTLVVSAKAFVFRIGQTGTVGGLADHQEQMAIFGLKIKDVDIGIVRSLNVKKRASPVGSDVDHDRTVGLPPAVLDQRADLGPSSELLEFGLDEVCVLEDKNTENPVWFDAFDKICT